MIPQSNNHQSNNHCGFFPNTTFINWPLKTAKTVEQEKAQNFSLSL